MVEAGTDQAFCQAGEDLGEVNRSRLAVKAHKFSASAREKILAAGGSVEEIIA